MIRSARPSKPYCFSIGARASGICSLPTPLVVALIGYLSFHACLRFRRSASRYVRLAHLYSAVRIAFVRSCYGQILGPRSYLPKFADSLWRRLDAWVHLDPHLIWQATESYMERRDAFGLVPHECSLLFQNS